MKHTGQTQEREEEEKLDILSGARKWRQLTGWPKYLQNFLLAAVTLLCAAWSVELHYIVGIAVFKEQFLALIFALAMAAIFLGHKPVKSLGNNRVPFYDWILVVISLACGLFAAVAFPDIMKTIGDLTPARVIFGFLSIFIVFEATRRSTGCWTTSWPATTHSASSSTVPPAPLSRARTRDSSLTASR